MDKPFLYVFLSYRIRKSSKGDLVYKGFLKEQVGRIIGKNGGVPRFMFKYIIEDLVKYGILTKVNKTNLYRLNEVRDEKEINFLD